MKDNKNEDQFPGYPHYPEGEDIMNLHNSLKTNIDPDTGQPKEQIAPQDTAAAESDPGAVSREEKEALSAAYQNRDLEDTDPEDSVLDTTDAEGAPLNERHDSYGRKGEDLDVPGSEADDSSEALGAEDEENNYYSLGGDNHEDLEENNST